MDLPKIDVNALPEMADLTGMFGSISGPGHDDSIVVIMVFVYEQIPPEPLVGLLS